MRVYSFFLLGAVLLAACGSGSVDLSPFGIAPYFQQYYDVHGGIRTLGAPIAVESEQNGARVQCFQNGVLEFHPELDPGEQVYMRPLGLQYGDKQPPIDPAVVPQGARYFPQTGHSVQGKFRGFFENYGGVEFFGYPVSEALVAGSDVLVQHFERASLRYDRTLPRELNVQLVAWGQQHYDDLADACSTIDSVIVQLTPAPGELVEEPAAVDPVLEYVARFGGEEVFGQPIQPTGTYPDALRVYENAAFINGPDAPGEVRLLPLGIQLRGRIDPPAQPLDFPEAVFIPETGHNVAYGFKPFFVEHGGLEVFGRPITEVFVQDGFLVQYFENLMIEWHTEAPKGKNARLSNVGQQYLAILESAASGGILQPALQVESWQYYPTANLDDAQVLYVRVANEYKAPVAGAEVRIDVHTPYATESHSLAPTNERGMSKLELELGAFLPGARVSYEVHVRAGALESALNKVFDITQAELP